MKAVYIAGPFRGSSSWDVAENVRRAERAAFEVAATGLYPVCPHTMFSNFDGTLTDDFWIRCTLDLLKRCDAMFVLDGFENSDGTLGEIDVFSKMQRPIFYHMHEVKLWWQIVQPFKVIR